ncbi:MAG: tyrosine-type recombinase/integrase [Lachnospiraceae bacterium]|nr:tyrosine-type recombinase/integrase [Lachnospiraceae bacterium]
MEELVNELWNYISGEVNDQMLKQRIYIICSNFDIKKKETELSVYTCEDYNTQILKKFIIGKAVKGLTERTIRHYETTLKMVFNVIQKQADMITADELKLYLAKRQVYDKVSSVTVGNEYRVLSSFYNWMNVEDIIQKNPMLKVEKPKVRKIKKKAFSTLECEMIRNGCRNSRERAIVEVLFSTWCRVSELAQMNISDIEGDELTILGKGKKERIVYLNAKAQLAIKNYLDEREDDTDYLLCSLDKPYDRLKVSGVEIVIRNLGKRIGVDNCHPHRFRRTGATLALKGGMPIEKVSYILGHESIETTQIYLDINEEEAKLAHKKYVV